MAPLTLVKLLSFLSLFSVSFQTTLQNQSYVFTLMKNSLPQWDNAKISYCNYTGVACDNDGYVTKIDVSGWHLVGQFPFPSPICSYLPKLHVLRLGHTSLRGQFPTSILNCSVLEELNLTSLGLIGTLPDFSPLKSLRILDLSNNYFQGDFPMSVLNLTDLEVLNFNELGLFTKWQLPEDVDRMAKLKKMILSTCWVKGPIPPSIGNMTSLVDLELSGNSLVGPIPAETGRLKNLQLLELYYNRLSGEIPDEIGNLTQLTDVDISVNWLTGNIPESLCKLPSLKFLQLYNNSLSGEIPPVIGNSTSLNLLSLYENFLTGSVPPNLGKFSDFLGMDLSENRLSGELPPEICKRGKLLFFLVLNNQFSGHLPESYAQCSSVVRFRVSYNRLDGPINDGILGLPHASIIDLSFNRFDGQLPKSICNAKNLSELFLQSNRFSGFLPAEISQATALLKIDLSNNLFSGPIPSEIGNLRRLNLLLLQGNKLDSSIPDSLSNLKYLNLLNLSSNLLTGKIPENLCRLLPGTLDFSNNQLSGPIPLPLLNEGLQESFSGNPGLCLPVHLNSTTQPNLPLCRKSNKRQMNSIWAVVICTAVLIVGLLLYLRHRCRKERVVVEQEAMLSTSPGAYFVKNFHKLRFNHHEIVEALIEKNMVGYGGSGTVYKIELSNGLSVAVKKLWTRKTKDPSSDPPFLDRELKAEVETLEKIRHKNIIKLYCCFSNSDLNLLIYEYMPNGSLWDALHRGKKILDWPTRHMIALGIAQGLAYLHHALLPPIIHRDIKSTNILLNGDFEPKVADFGVAKAIKARGSYDSTTTIIAGTYGYLAPEYAYSPKATVKCDVYSFGVVLIELITGKKPLEAEFGENRNIVYWVSQKITSKEGVMDVLDKRLSGCPFKDEMIQVLRIAIRCTCVVPSIRPTMNEIVQLLMDADPCRFDGCKSSDKLKN